jgi:hypothetical protein
MAAGTDQKAHFTAQVMKVSNGLLGGLSHLTE